MKVTIFGAGASHSYTGSKTGVRPPLAKEIFTAFNQLEISTNHFVRIGNLINYVRDTRKINPLEFNTWNENIEDLLTEIQEKLIRNKPKGFDIKYIELIKTYDQLIFLFESILNEIQNGEICINYSGYIGNRKEADIFISFNWDCLLDRSLYSTGCWFPEDGYCLNFQKFFYDGWATRITEDKSKNKLLKLHGSTNWLIPYLTFNPNTGERSFPNTNYTFENLPLFCFIQATKPYVTYQNRYKAGYEPFSYFYYPPNIPIKLYKPPKGRKTFSTILTPDVPNYGKVVIEEEIQESMPMIIPPVKEKEYSLFKFMDILWDEAWRGLVSCDELYIIGYSFPPTDKKPWLMIESAINYRKTNLPITIIDPNSDQLKNRLNEKFRGKIEISIIQKKFEEYVKQIL